MTLHFQFQKRLADFVLNVDVRTDGGVLALFGHSGCGKSTTVNALAGLLKPDSGRIQLGDDVLFDSTTGVDIAAERRRIGYVFQDSRLFPHYDVIGNLLYGRQRARQAPTQPISLDTVVELLGLRALLNRRSAQLSGGEKQRVALGRALLSQPRLLLMDEPLASLDQARRDEVLPYLERVRDELKTPIVYVSHQFEEVLQLATHVVLLEQGQVIAQGDLPSLSMQPALRRIVGAEAIGAVIEGQVRHIDAVAGLAQIGVGRGTLSVDATALTVQQRVRLQLLARDLILAIEPPRGLSVRNMLPGRITHLSDDDRHATLAQIDVGGAALIARITRAAATELNLRVGLSLWVLVKAVTLRGHVYHGAAP